MYILFAYDRYDTCSPIESIIGIFDTLEKAKEGIINTGISKGNFGNYDIYEIYDTELKKEIYSIHL